MKIFLDETKNPRWRTAEDAVSPKIDLDIVVDEHENGKLQTWAFTASPDDATEYGRLLFDRAKKGDFGTPEPHKP